MTQPIPPFTMETFERMAREFYPEETKQMYFVDTSDPGHRSRIIDFISNITPADRDFFFKHRGGAEGYAQSLIDYEGMAEYKCDTPSGQKMIVIDVKYYRENAYKFGKNADALLWEAAFHELGHGIVPNAASNGMPLVVDEKQRPKPTEYSVEATRSIQNNEISADGFSALWRLKLGMTSSEKVHDEAFDRAYFSVWLGKHLGYATFQALDKIVIDAKTADFVSLTPQEIKGIAARHAETFTKSTDELNSAFGALDTLRVQGDEAPMAGTPVFMKGLEGLRKNL